MLCQSLMGEGGENTQQSLEDAEEAMRRAEEALEEGDFSGALDRQAEAMENLREGLRNLSRSLAQGKMPRPKRAGPAHQDSVLSNRIHWGE